ncbi:MAG: YcaO-like family protein [Ilumatobacteraceae bacterium]
MTGSVVDLGSSRRAVPAEQTLARARGSFERVGITRLADITGLDRIGIPVWLALRPNGRALSGGQGKGVTDAAAQASAVMETIETWHAERLPRGDVASFSALGRARALDPTTLDPGPDIAGWDPTQQLAWLTGTDLLGGAETFVARQALDLDLTDLTAPRFVAGTTNGLASGNDRDEATVHGLYELVERDAERRWRQLPSARRARTVIAEDELAIDHPLVAELLDQVRAADCHVAVLNCTGPTAIATYRCVITDRIREFRPLACSGVGAHGVARVALLRAITEAAQTRATLIAGSRDDRYPSLYASSFLRVGRDGSSAPPPPGCSFTDGVDEVAAPCPAKEVESILARLVDLGTRRVIAVDLTRPELGLPVVRVAAERFLLPGPYGR